MDIANEQGFNTVVDGSFREAMMSTTPVPESCNHVLAEFDSMDPLLSAIRLDSIRLKCTCISVSRKWLALGSSAGGLHLIQKDGWKQRLILTHKEGAISRVACCPHDEDYVAVATSQGFVVVWELNQERRGKPERVYVSSEHKGKQVTAMCWDTAILRIFVGDDIGKVSAIKINSSKQGKAVAFVMFPVQLITTVDSRVVQLDYLDGKLLVSSFTRCYLCDTEREKFWKIGNKEREGDYGACFFPIKSQQPLIYCARPGSRMWEVNFEGKVLSTHQFKHLLSSPPLPLISHRFDPTYDPRGGSSQSIPFPKLLFIKDQHVITWTERGIFIFIPQNVQVLLWCEVKDVLDIAVSKHELFCLHVDGRISHFYLLPAERCVERLMRREMWGLAATVCHLFNHSIVSSRARKTLPVDKLEHLKGQLDISTQQDLISQLEDIVSKLEPLESACSSRRSSISSHESFNILDCGIYRVISRRGSHSDEDSSSLYSQTLSEDDRLKEFSMTQEEEQAEMDNMSHASMNTDVDRNETLLPFHISLPFRPASPRVSLQAVRESVTKFVRKTTEKIGNLHMSSDLKQDSELKDEDQQCEVAIITSSYVEETEVETDSYSGLTETDPLQELREATAAAIAQLQDSCIVFEVDCLKKVLQKWLPNLETAFNIKREVSSLNNLSTSLSMHSSDEPEEENSEEALLKNNEIQTVNDIDSCEEGERLLLNQNANVEETREHVFRIHPPCLIPADISKDVMDLTTLCFELNVFAAGEGISEGTSESLPMETLSSLACHFMEDYFFLLDLKRLKHSIITCYPNCLVVWDTYIQGLKEMTQSHPVTSVIEDGELKNVMKVLKGIQSWDSPLVLAHIVRFYEKYGESALRAIVPFYPSIVPSDVKQLCRENPAHFVAYLDRLVKSKPENERLPLLSSLLQPETLRLEWLQLAVSLDAPHKDSCVDAEGKPRAHSHLFTWGYAHLISLLIKLPGDSATTEKMADICRCHGFWLGYLSLCLALEQREEAFTTVVYLDDMSLLNDQKGLIPATLDEWKFLLQLAHNCNSESHHHEEHNGSDTVNGSLDCSNCVSVENLVLLLAKMIGPDSAMMLVQDCGLTTEFTERFTAVCNILKIAEKRQRALIQSMLEKCDRFLWSQQA
ncbi:Hermansky-Pudlak syndrome 5 protein isoform X2 [Protopterus annectens]|uniref:Hermansky-Pudlak syndrome 5 protein isoform X2 n=1 Tax=Protopterus annectens TaxID=7888 RepID=UPI001CF95122|nr:Hermansky-Pudlak syndrome 5 protein isoform X2 [Protopterus annectens]